MHESSQDFSLFDYSQGFVAVGRLDSWSLDRDSHRWAAFGFVGMEIDGRQPIVRFEPPGRCGLDWQSQPAWTRQHLRLGSRWQTDTAGSSRSAEAGEGLDEIAHRVRNATYSLGWCGGGGVSAERVQRRTETPSSPQLAQAPGLCLEASGLSLHSSQQRGSGWFSTRVEKKLDRILNQAEKALLIFADESGFSLHPKLGRVWAKRGSRPSVPTTSQHQKRLNLFGWVDPLKGWHGLFRWAKGNTDGFLAFLKYLCHRVEKTKVYLYIDKAPWHKGPRVEEFLKAHPNIEVEYLPTYHPELNVQERVWHLIRYEVTTNQYHATIDLIEQAIRKRQRHWKSKQIKTLCKVI